jgi:hypothetical protein
MTLAELKIYVAQAEHDARLLGMTPGQVQVIVLDSGPDMFTPLSLSWDKKDLEHVVINVA